MEITSYHLMHTLSYDSLYNILSWYDRITIHQFLNGKLSFEDLSGRVRLMATIIAENNMEGPEMRIGQDLLTYYKNPVTKEWIQVEYFHLNNPQYEMLTNLKNNI